MVLSSIQGTNYVWYYCPPLAEWARRTKISCTKLQVYSSSIKDAAFTRLVERGGIKVVFLTMHSCMAIIKLT